jgi:hypothetical protein
MTTNAVWTRTLAEHGVPVIGRIAVSGVDRGNLVVDCTPTLVTFSYFEDEDDDLQSVNKGTKTHTGKGYTVYMTRNHLAKHQEDEEL